MAKDVFPEAEYELRVAHKLKEKVLDEETKKFLEVNLGVVVSCSSSDGQISDNPGLGLEMEEDEEDDDDDAFCQEEEKMDDFESLTADNKEEMRLVTETIGKDEMDALSITSVVGGSDFDDITCDERMSADEDDSNDGGIAKKRVPRRSRRNRFTIPIDLVGGGDNDKNNKHNETLSTRPDTDLGALKFSNIVQGKRRRTKVDYRK